MPISSTTCRGYACHAFHMKNSIYCEKCLPKSSDANNQYQCSALNCFENCAPLQLYCHQHMDYTKATIDIDVVAKDIADLKTSVQNIETILKKDLASMADHLEILVSRLDTLEKNK